MNRSPCDLPLSIQQGIYAAFDGHNHATLSRRFCLTQETIYRVINQETERREQVKTDVVHNTPKPLSRWEQYKADAAAERAANPEQEPNLAHSAISWFRLGLILMLGATALQLVVAASTGFSECLPAGGLRLLQIISNVTMMLAIGVMLLPEKKV